MKKKVLSVVLASALFAGAAVSASAIVWGDWDSSSKSGDDSDITALAFTEKSYTIRNGAAPKNMNEVITAYAGDKAIVQEPELEWEISENDLAFELNTEDNKATVAAFENKGSATITVTANEGKVKATCKVVAAPLIKATGFKFEHSTYTLPTGIYVADKSVQTIGATDLDDKTIKLVSTPTDAVFSDFQKREFDNMQIALVASKDFEQKDKNGNVIVSISKNDVLAVSDSNDENKFKFNASTLAGLYAGVTNARLIVVKAGSVQAISNSGVTRAAGAPVTSIAGSEDFTKVEFSAYDADKTGKTIARDVRAATEMGRPAERAGRTGTITIEVGQKADLGDYVKYGPTNANVKKEVGQWTIDYYNAAATDDDFAVLNDDKDAVLGVAVGRVKAVTTFEKPDGSTMEVEVPINVVARGAKSEPETPVATTESATLAIGGTYWAESGNENTEWTVDNDNVTIVPEKGAGCKIFAKKAGTATVTGTVDGEVVKTVNVTITAAGTTTPDVPSEANPSTGDSLLAFLF